MPSTSGRNAATHRFHDEAMDATDRRQGRPAEEAQHDRVHQTARPGHDGRPAADPPQHGNRQLAANVFADFLAEPRTAADDDQRPIGFPEADRLHRLVRGGRIFQQGLVEGQILRGRGQRQIEKLHGGIMVRL